MFSKWFIGQMKTEFLGILMLFITFNPSVRKTLFFQKKIKQLNVEFIEAIVKPQVPIRLT